MQNNPIVHIVAVQYKLIKHNDELRLLLSVISNGSTITLSQSLPFLGLGFLRRIIEFLCPLEDRCPLLLVEVLDRRCVPRQTSFDFLRPLTSSETLWSP